MWCNGQIVPKEQMLCLWATQYKEQLEESPIQDMKLKNTKQHKHATNEEHDQFIFTTSINTFKILEVK